MSRRWGREYPDDVGGLYIPGEIMRNWAKTGITPTEWVVLQQLAVYHYEVPGGISCPSQTRIAEEVGLSLDRVNKVVARLKRKGFITVDDRPGATSIYSFAKFGDLCHALATGVCADMPSTRPEEGTANLTGEPPANPQYEEEEVEEQEVKKGLDIKQPASYPLNALDLIPDKTEGSDLNAAPMEVELEKKQGTFTCPMCVERIKVDLKASACPACGQAFIFIIGGKRQEKFLPNTPAALYLRTVMPRWTQFTSAAQQRRWAATEKQLGESDLKKWIDWAVNKKLPPGVVVDAVCTAAERHGTLTESSKPKPTRWDEPTAEEQKRLRESMSRNFPVWDSM